MACSSRIFPTGTSTSRLSWPTSPSPRDWGDLMTTLKSNARIVVPVREAGDAGSVAANWTPLRPDRSSALWTDDYSNILGAMLRKKFGG